MKRYLFLFLLLFISLKANATVQVFLGGNGANGVCSGTGQLCDTSGQGRNATLVGTVANPSTGSPPEGSNWLIQGPTDASNQLTVPTAAFDSSTGQGYIEFYFKQTASLASPKGLFHIALSGGGGTQYIYIYVFDSGGFITVQAQYYHSNGTGTGLSGPSLLSYNVNHTIKFSWDTSAAHTYVTLDGVQGTDGGTIALSSATAIKIGYDVTDFVGLSANSFLDGFQISNDTSDSYPFVVSTPTPTSTFTSTNTKTQTPTPTVTQTWTITKTSTITQTNTPTPTATVLYIDADQKNVDTSFVLNGPLASQTYNQQLAVKFKPTELGPISKVWLYLRKTGAVSATNVGLTLWSDSGNGPGSSIQSYGTVNTSSLTSNYAYVTFTPSSFATTLIPGTTYWLVLAPNTSGPFANQIQWGLNNSLDYLSMQGTSGGNATWISIDPDFIFVEYSTNWTPTSTPTKVNSSTSTPTFTVSKTSTISNTFTKTNTGTQTSTSTLTVTKTSTRSNTFTKTQTSTSTVTSTPTQTGTSTQTPTKTSTPTISNTFTKTFTPTSTATKTFTLTLSPTSTLTKTLSFTKTITSTPSITPSITLTFTLTSTRSYSSTKTFTSTMTITQTFSMTPTLSFTRSQTFTKTQTPTITKTNTGTSTFTNTQTSTITKTFTISPTSTITPTSSNTSQFTHTSTPTSSITLTSTITKTSTVTLTRTPTSTVTQTKTPIISTVYTNPQNYQTGIAAFNVTSTVEIDITSTVSWISSNYTVSIVPETIISDTTYSIDKQNQKFFINSTSTLTGLPKSITNNIDWQASIIYH